MPKHILIAVDDDPKLLRALLRDLRRHYAEDYRVVRADSEATRSRPCRGSNIGITL
jgi:thioredoxin reductase (NADPH)